MDKVDETQKKGLQTEDKVANMLKIAKLQQAQQEGWEEDILVLKRSVDNLQTQIFESKPHTPLRELELSAAKDINALVKRCVSEELVHWKEN